jgi:hypothetical protein
LNSEKPKSFKAGDLSPGHVDDDDPLPRHEVLLGDQERRCPLQQRPLEVVQVQQTLKIINAQKGGLREEMGIT